MAAPALNIAQITSDGHEADTLRRTFNGLQSKELIIALSGPIGSGLSEVFAELQGVLSQMDYSVVSIKISALISKYAPSLLSSTAQQSHGAGRYTQLQQQGNELRRNKGLDFLSQLAIREISLDRFSKHPNTDPAAIVPNRVAYIVDQLKHPAEVSLLRAVYGESFFLLGVLCNNDQRRRNLCKQESIEAAEAEDLMARDRQQEEKYGQKLEKTLQLADFFVRNSKSNSPQLRAPIERFVKLIHGAIGITPTRQEQGMYAAYSAGLSSACLSRQVGAAIHDRDGKLVATGCNDVPRGGGGLYREADSKDDHRCMHLSGGICFNHLEKDKLKGELAQIIGRALESHLSRFLDNNSTPSLAALRDVIAAAIRSESRLKDILEFSRSVHAEMDCLVSLARSGSGCAQDGVLYTTTYPCHNCARHIVAAGIKAVYFIEPYEKSLALELHSDSITHCDDEEILTAWIDPDRSRHRKVQFLHFEGVAPSRYIDLFSAFEDRKDCSGKAIKWTARAASKRVPEYLEGYIDLESRVTENLKKLGVEDVR